MSSKCYLRKRLPFVVLAVLFRLSLNIVSSSGFVNCPRSWYARNVTNECYFISNDTADFFNANALCRQMSADLTSIPDGNSSDYLITAILSSFSACDNQRTCPDYWFGLFCPVNVSNNETSCHHENSGWSWIDGSNYSVTWNRWNVSSLLGDGDCAFLHASENIWMKKNCSAKLRYICSRKMKDLNTSTTSSNAAVKVSSSLVNNRNVTPLNLFNVSSTAFPVNLESMILSNLLSSVPVSSISVTQLTTSSPLSFAVDTSDILSRSFSDVSMTIAPFVENSTTGPTERHSVFTVSSDQDLPLTSYHVDNSVTVNETALAAGSSLPLMAICISVSVGALVITAVIIAAICVCCRRRRKLSQTVSFQMRRASELSDDYDDLDNVTENIDGVIPRRRDVRVHPDASDGFHLRTGSVWPPRGGRLPGFYSTAQQAFLDEYRQLNEHLLTLKRPLENYVNNDIVSEELTSYMSSASSKILDIIWQSTGNVSHRRPRIVPPLRSFAYEILYSDVFFLENLVSLQLQIATLLQLFPANGVTSIINQCRLSLENVEALLKIGMENVSYASLVKSGYSDVLLDANPLFRELLGQLTIIRLRLETYHLLDACIEPSDVWKSKLLECLSEAESAITEAFSDVLESSVASEPVPVVSDGENFPQLLRQRLMRFRLLTDPVMPQVKRFLQSVDGNAAYYVSITLDEIGQLAANILDPRSTMIFPEEDELNLELMYQNLPSVYDLPNPSTYYSPSLSDRGITLMESPINRDSALPPNDNDDDTYDETPGGMVIALEDVSNSYDDDYFEVSVDRTSPTCLEGVLSLYKSTPLDQLQRNIRVSFVGEAGLDGGALSREFFFMSFNSLIGQPFLSHLLFEGSRGHLLPAIDHVLTDSKVFWFVGVLIAQAVNKGCRGLPGLSDAVRHFLSHGAKIKNIDQSLEKVTPEDIADGELRLIVRKVQAKESLTEEERSVFENWARDSNFSKVLGPATELEAVQRIFCHYVFNSRMTQLQAISEGISDVLIGTVQTSEIERMFPVEEKMSYDDLMSGILVEPSNECQQKAFEYFKKFCHELCNGSIDDLTLEMLLQFFTGGPYFVSMVGAQVRFAEPVEKNALPFAHACASELILPTVHRDYESFRCAMVKALEYSGTGFGII